MLGVLAAMMDAMESGRRANLIIMWMCLVLGICTLVGLVMQQWMW